MNMLLVSKLVNDVALLMQMIDNGDIDNLKYEVTSSDEFAYESLFQVRKIDNEYELDIEFYKIDSGGLVRFFVVDDECSNEATRVLQYQTIEDECSRFVFFDDGTMIHSKF